MAYRIETLNITTTGSAGSATGSAASELLAGTLELVVVNYTSMPATTDVTISYTINGATKTLLTLTNNNTDFVDAIFDVPVSAAGADSTLTEWKPFLPGVSVTVSVAQGDAVTDGVKVMLIVGD